MHLSFINDSSLSYWRSLLHARRDVTLILHVICDLWLRVTTKLGLLNYNATSFLGTGQQTRKHSNWVFRMRWKGRTLVPPDRRSGPGRRTVGTLEPCRGFERRRTKWVHLLLSRIKGGYFSWLVNFLTLLNQYQNLFRYLYRLPLYVTWLWKLSVTHYK